jgi:threonine/homoserine/homoserine lactone efflux protein
MSALLSDVLGFAAVAGLLTIVPGLDTAMVLRSTAAGGRRHGAATALGVCSGTLIWGAAAAVGISALLTASTIAYTVVRVAGAGYMVWIGARLLIHAVRRDGEALAMESIPTDRRSVARSWGRGLTTNLLNPKIGAFYVAIMPQFIPPHASHLAVGLLLALVHAVEGLIWFTAIILAAHTVRSLLERRPVRRAIDAVTGTTLIGFGVRLSIASK